METFDCLSGPYGSVLEHIRRESETNPVRLEASSWHGCHYQIKYVSSIYGYNRLSSPSHLTGTIRNWQPQDVHDLWSPGNDNYVVPRPVVCIPTIRADLRTHNRAEEQ